MQRAFVIQHGFGLETVAGQAGEATAKATKTDNRRSFIAEKAYKQPAAKQCPARDLS